jgi:hypothetical protein
MRFVVFGEDGDAQPFAAGTVGERLDLVFAAEIAAVILVGFENESFEISEAVEYETAHLAGVSGSPFTWLAVVAAPGSRVTEG